MNFDVKITVARVMMPKKQNSNYNIVQNVGMIEKVSYKTIHLLLTNYSTHNEQFQTLTLYKLRKLLVGY